jgi:hypothetical protein
MRPKLQKQSALKLAGRIIPRSGGFNTPKLAAESLSKACFGVHTHDYFLDVLFLGRGLLSFGFGVKTCSCSMLAVG